MEISQLKAAVAQSLSLHDTAPEASQVTAFLDKLAAKNIALPEQNLINQMQVNQAQLVKGIEQSGVAAPLSPERALAVQYGLASSVIGVDMVAKVAGSFSQAINKLVTMQ